MRMVVNRITYVVLTILSVAAAYGLFTFLPHESHSVEVDLEVGMGVKREFDFKIKERCTYEVGIAFGSKAGSTEIIKSLFGERATKLNLPAKIDISVKSDGSDTVFSVSDFGGEKLWYRYGPDPVKFIAGKVYLAVGDYKAEIHIKELQGDFSPLEAQFFVARDPKVTCK